LIFEAISDDLAFRLEIELSSLSGVAKENLPIGAPVAGNQEEMMSRQERTSATQEIRVEQRLPSYWRVTFDLPPVNIFGPKETLQLSEIISLIEKDEQVKVVVFDSAVDGFFLTHYDFLAPLEESAKIPPGPTGLQALPDMLVRLSRAPVVSIASIRGRATGVGSELALVPTFLWW
jgi:enoyl-CoA hydratase/carnithine racemase